jgi:hypothetical protein
MARFLRRDGRPLGLYADVEQTKIACADRRLCRPGPLAWQGGGGQPAWHRPRLAGINNVIDGAQNGAIVGHRWAEPVTGDLASSGNSGYAHLTIGRKSCELNARS